MCLRIPMAVPDGLLGLRSWRRLQSLADDLRTGGHPWALFLGAGLSSSAGLLGWEAFIRAAANQFDVGCPPPGYLHEDLFPRLAQECHDAAPTPAHFWRMVEDEYCRHDVPAPDPLRQLMGLPFELYVTTNFDCLAETPHDGLDGVPVPRSLAYPDINAVDLHSRRLVFLHGRCRCGAEPGHRLDGHEIVLTEDGYDLAYSPNTTLENAIDAIFSKYNVLMVGAGLSDRPIQAVLDVVRQREKSRERLTGKVEPVRRYAIVASRWAPDGDDDDSLDKWRGMAFRIEPIFYFNGPGENHEDLPKVTGHLSKLVLGA